MGSRFCRLSFPVVLFVSVPLFAQTQAVTTNAGDESQGSYGAAITAINNSGAGGAVSFAITSPNSTISLTQPNYPPAATQSITLEGNTATLQNTGSNPVSLLSTNDFSLADGAAFSISGVMASAGTDNSGTPGLSGGTGGDGGDVAVTALTSSLGVSASLSIADAGHGGAGGNGGTGANGGNGGAGGGIGITVGTLALGNGAYLNAVAGLGGPGGSAGAGGAAGSGGAGGSASASIGSLATAADSNINLEGGGGNGGSAGGSGGWAMFNAGSVTMNGNMLIRGGDGGTGTSSNGDGGSVEVTIGSMTLGNSAAFGADGGASGGAGALAGNSSVTVGSLDMGTGSFFAASGSSPSVSVSLINGAGTLSATNGTVQVYAGTYNGTLNASILNVPSSGAFDLEGVAALTVGTDVAGSLVLGNTLATTAVLNGTVTVASGGTLSGFGTIHGALTNSGTIVPESPTQIGALTMTQFDQTSGGLLRLNLQPGDNQSDSLAEVSGAQLGGGVSVFSSAGGNFGFRDRYAILSGGPVTGTFSTLANSISGMSPYMLYGSNAVTFVLLQSGVDFTVFAHTPNQTAVADVLNTVLLTCGDAFSAKEGELDNLPSGQTAILDQLSGVIYTSLPNVLFDNLQFEDDLLFSRLGGNTPSSLPGAQASFGSGLLSDVTGPLGSTAKPGPSAANGLWLVNADSFGSVNATTNVLGFNKSNVGFLGGYDVRLSQDLTGGLMGGWLHTDLKQSDSTAEAGVDGIQFGLYGNQRLGDMDLSAVAGYGVDHFKVDRTITLGSDINQMEGAYDGSQLMGALQWDYRLVDVDTTITPFAGLEVAHLAENAFTESGSSTLNLSIPSQTYDSLQPYVGLGETWNLSLGKDLQLVPGLRASVSEELMNTASQFQTAFGGASGNPFTVAGITPDSTEFSVDGGAQFLIGKAFALFAAYNGRFSGSQALSTVSGGLSLSF